MLRLWRRLASFKFANYNFHIEILTDMLVLDAIRADWRRSAGAFMKLKKMSNTTSRLACIAVALILSACGQKGTEFVGTWQCVKYANRSAQIERNGDNFLVKDITPSMFTHDKMETNVLPAVYKDGVLVVLGGFGTANVGYVKASDTLLMPTIGGSLEYHRVK